MAMTAGGLAKLAEECGELLQVIGKKLAYYTTQTHPDDGPPLDDRLRDEMADVAATIGFVAEAYKLDMDAFERRADLKCPDSDVPLCMFDKTYPEMIAIAHAAEAREGRRDRERLDWLEGEFQREHDWMMTAQWGGNPCPKSLFRKNEPITREAIDAARAAEKTAAA